ncbi:MAG TPA: branched-chain amino acid ABC transporter permease [Gaiellaceae bacterium]|nr:branched-chain amino acid ABC transporter permease [Gaiellaceae bacterium]
MRRLYLLGAAAVVLVVLPFVLSDFRTVQLATVGAYFIAIIGLDVLIGHSGQVSLGHGGLMAVGGYTTAILMAHHGVQDLCTIPLAALVAGAVGLLFGLPALRLSGLFLALATFGIAVVLPTLLKRFDHFTGGSSGVALFGLPQQSGQGAGYLGMTNDTWLYALTWTIGIALFALAWWLLSSRFGRALRAARDSEPAAAAVGINRSAYRVAAFGISAAYAGVAGALYAINVAYVSPDTYSVQLSLFLLVGAVVGAYGSIWGALGGALLIEFLPDLAGTLPHVSSKEAGPATFFFGAVLIVIVLLLHLVRKVSAR